MTQTFPAWLRDQESRDDDTGEFARGIGTADDFPEHGGKAIYDGWFESETDDRREQFERAWSEFDANSQPSATSERPEGFGS